MSNPGKYWDVSWNPIVGCKKCSPGCRRCWALSTMLRLCAYGQPLAHPYDAAGAINSKSDWSGKHFLIERWLEKPLHWKRPRTIAVGWLGDMWREEVPQDWIRFVLDVAKEAAQHHYLFLTKRPENMLTHLYHPITEHRNWWHGLTVCNQDEAGKKIPHLLEILGKRWLSMEPLLGPIDLRLRCPACGYTARDCGIHMDHRLCGKPEPNRIDWVVVGGETGPRARPCDPAWVRSIVSQCQDAGVPVWVKQAPDPVKSQTEGYSDIISGKTFPWPREKPAGMP